MYEGLFMKKIVIISAVLLLLGGGAFGFYVTKPAEAGDSEKAAKQSKEFNKNSEFVELSPLVLPIIDSNGLSQTISVVVAIEVSSSSDAKKVESIAPKLQDAYIQDMYGVLSAQSSLNESGAVEVKVLKQRLTRVSQSIAGEIVDDVLLQVVSQQSL